MPVIVPQTFASIQKQDEKLVRKEYYLRIKSILREHNPSKLANLPKLLDKWKGKEHMLYMKVCQKYKEPKMKKYKAPSRENSFNLDSACSPNKVAQRIHISSIPVIAEISFEGSFTSLNDDQPSELPPESPISEIPFIEELNKSLTEAKGKIETLRQEKAECIAEAKAKIDSLKVESKQCSQKLSKAELEIARLQEINQQLHQRNLKLIHDNKQMEKKLMDISTSLKAPPALTSPFLDHFSPAQLRDQDEQLCHISLEISRVRKKILRVQESAKTCGICLDHKKDCILNPCGHGYCFQCASLISRCAFCKQQKTSVIKLFW